MPILLSLTRAVIVSIAVALAFLSATSVQAQESVTALPSPLTPDAINSLVSRLSDQEVRDLLLQELGSRADAATETPAKPRQSIVDATSQTLGLAVAQITRSAATAPGHAAAALAALESYFGSLGTQGLLRFLFVLAIALTAGIVVDQVYAHKVPTKPMPSASAVFDPAVLLSSMRSLAHKLLRDAGGAILALIVSVAILALALQEREARVGFTAILWLVFFPRITWIVLRFLLAPHQPDQRFVVTDDWTARVLSSNLVGLSLVVGFFETLSRVNLEIGADPEAQQVGFWINMLVFAWLAGIFVICRRGLRSIVRGRAEQLTRIEEWMVVAYPVYSVLLIVLTWFVGEIADAIGKDEVVQQGGHFLGLGLLLIAPISDTFIRMSVRLLVPPMTGSGVVAVEAFVAAWRSYIRIARVVVFGALVMLLSWIWDVALFGGSDGSATAPFSGQFAESLLIVLVGYVALEVTSLLANRKLSSIEAETAVDETLELDEGPIGTAPTSRLGTILPPISWALQAGIIVVTLLTALGHLGVNVTALLAGAGVLGLAIGFGAQKLVSDVISGLFFLVDDAFRLNEYINAGGVEGTVERIALRSMLLRQSDGAIHCIPYSEMSSVTNFGRDWGTMKQVFTVPFDTDVEKVRKIFKKIGQDLYDNPEFQDAFIQPFKFKGVSQVNDVGIVLRGKFMFKPALSKQFLIQREIYKRVQADFAKAGINFARREVRVSVQQSGGAVADQEVQAIALGAASADAVQAAAMAALPKSAT